MLPTFLGRAANNYRIGEPELWFPGLVVDRAFLRAVEVSDKESPTEQWDDLRILCAIEVNLPKMAIRLWNGTIKLPKDDP